MPEKEIKTKETKEKKEKRENPIFFENWNETKISKTSFAHFEKIVRGFAANPKNVIPDDVTKEEIKEAHEHFKNVKKG